MPDMDGTGPKGRGPLSGRGRGICFQGLSKKRTVKVLSFLVPVALAVIDDAMNPDGISRKLYRNVRFRLAGRRHNEIPERSPGVYDDGISRR